MNNLFQRFSEFMRGRYGADTLNGFIAAVSVILWIVNVFVFNWTARGIISVIQLGLIGLFIFRMLSRNINARSRANRAFLRFYNPVKNWFKLQIRKFRERDDYRYVRCPGCKAQLRVRNQKGKHTVRCPKCNYEFSKTIH